MMKPASAKSWQDWLLCLFKCNQFHFNMTLKNDACLSCRYSHGRSLIIQEAAFKNQHGASEIQLMECTVLITALSSMGSNQLGKYCRPSFFFCAWPCVWLITSIGLIWWADIKAFINPHEMNCENKAEGTVHEGRDVLYRSTTGAPSRNCLWSPCLFGLICIFTVASQKSVKETMKKDVVE